MCNIIGRLLVKTEGFGAREPARLLQLPTGYSVMQILVHPESGLAGRTLRELCDDTVVILGLVREDGTYLSRPGGSE
ncbi:MAG: hypothetical protein V3S87_08665, partial [Alphaproteobacteria bacterium]